MLSRDFTCDGPVEYWLNGLLEVMWATIKAHIADGYATYVETSRTAYGFSSTQPRLSPMSQGHGSRWRHTKAFDQLEDGNESAIKDFLKHQKSQLDGLISLVLGELTKGMTTLRPKV